ncbi:MAG: tetratricopeptide repeat protein [candidate division Zixibacteria bacterium]|jgi:tetratricopeptide (TPR) repeat protein|nr:tetratricopeptide repeat protein [candidate division Zixibacteria bacterium]
MIQVHRLCKLVLILAVVQIGGRAANGDPNLLVTQANELGRSGDCRRALVLYDQAIREAPTYPNAYFNRGVCYNELGEVDSAFLDYSRAIERDPGFFPARYNRGRILAERKQWEDAANDFERAFLSEPTFLPALGELAHALFRLNEMDSALVVMNALIERDPSNPYHFNNRGEIYKILGRFDEALIDYNTALTIDPTAAEIYHSLAQLCVKTGDSDGELRYLELFLQYANPYTDPRVDSVKAALAHRAK